MPSLFSSKFLGEHFLTHGEVHVYQRLLVSETFLKGAKYSEVTAAGQRSNKRNFMQSIIGTFNSISQELWPGYLLVLNLCRLRRP